jgi:LmbE family N-acetylglucosaminyl deacetylase
VYYVIVTDGSGGGPDNTDTLDLGSEARQQVIVARQHEQRTASGLLGVEDVFFLGYPDGALQFQPMLEVRRDLVRLLRRYRPTRVICQSPDRTWEPGTPVWVNHADHLAAGKAAIEAIYTASQNRWEFPELLLDEGLEPHKVDEVYFLFAPVFNHFEVVTKTIEVKEAALRAHSSQFGGAEGIEDMVKLMLSWDRESGRAMRHWIRRPWSKVYAERFYLALNH